MQPHQIVSRDEWLSARTAYLAEEKAFTRARDELSRKRRALPWVKVEQTYVFDGRSQLIVYHFMLGPDWEHGCPSCSLLADHFDGAVIHLAQRDVTFLVVSRAPLPQIEAFKRRMGWHFKWLSSYANTFNYDYHVSFTPEQTANGDVYYNYARTTFPSEEAPGASVFWKNDAGEIFHTYSCYGRGLDILIGAYNLLDLAPKGRDEEGLAWSMAWVRHHDRYDGAVADSKASYQQPNSCCD